MTQAAQTQEFRGWVSADGSSPTVRHDEIKRHYYTSFPTLNPTRIVPLGDTPDFDAPHDRCA